ncbi:MAG: hypothetical protein ACREJO_14280 [Phycisphaerales bacterium]
MAFLLLPSSFILTGCSSDEQPQPNDLAAATSVPAVVGMGSGMEVRTWATRDGQANLTSVLAPYVDRPVRMDPAVKQTWSQCGLRLVSVPVADLPKVIEALTPTIEYDAGGAVASVSTLWIGQGPRFGEAVRGTSSPTPRTIAMHDSRVLAPAGTLRILARCWVIPDLAAPEGGDVPAAIQVELVPQMHEPRRAVDPLDPQTSAATPAEQGLVFTRLRAAIVLTPGDALLIVPESPLRDWKAAAADRPETSPPDAPEVGRFDPARPEPSGPAPSVAAGPTIGPPSDGVQTIGQQMFIFGGNETGSRRLRVMTALIPRAPERYEPGR